MTVFVDGVEFAGDEDLLDVVGNSGSMVTQTRNFDSGSEVKRYECEQWFEPLRGVAL